VQNQWRSYSRLALVGFVVALMGGCKGGGRPTTSGAVESRGAADTGMAKPPSDTGQMASTSGALTDANIVALLDEANAADSASGAYALGKTTNPDVKAFAKLMMGEHHALRAQGRQLAQRLKITPQPPANDPLKPAAEGEMTALKTAPKGAQFDRTYIEQEIGIHKAVLDLAAKAHDATQNEDLKKLIEHAKPVIEKHLNRAEEIQKKLGRPSA